MDFFKGHYFSFCGSSPESLAVIRKNPLYYGIQYNHAGQFFLSVDHSSVLTAEGPHAFITHPEAYFEYGCVENKPRHHTFICSYGERVEHYVRSGLLPLEKTASAVPIRNPEKFLQTMLAVIALSAQPTIVPRAVLLYEDLLLQMHESRQNEKKLPPFQEDCFRNLIASIRKHPEQEWDFRKEAEKLNITLVYFRRIFREHIGMPPNQFLIQCRLQYAAKLLISTHDPVGNIAETVGIGNMFYFSRLFKDKYQFSPLEYRKEFRGRFPC